MGNGKIFGMFVEQTDNGSSVTSKVKRYPTYQDMVDDKSPAVYAIVDENNTVYHRVDNEWIVGFPVLADEKDYTAFEVYPTSRAYAPGEFIRNGYPNSVEIAACDAHHFIVRSIYSIKDQNVVIDWGDGSTTDIAKDAGVKVYGATGSWDFVVRHQYKELDKPYIVKIYGNTYFGIMGENASKFIDDGSGDAKCYLTHNLISRIFDKDLPVASCISNAASMCRYGRRLISVNVYGHPIVRQVSNWTLCFSGCTNLYMAWGFQDDNLNVSACNEMLANCISMVATDFRIPRAPRSSTTANTIYNKCNNLTSSVSSLLEGTDFFVTPFKIGSMFAYTKVTMTAEEAVTVGAKLWNNPNIEFTSTSNCFKGCSAEVRALVPTTWGGTLTV